jgi:hypothetical protein
MMTVSEFDDVKSVTSLLTSPSQAKSSGQTSTAKATSRWRMITLPPEAYPTMLPPVAKASKAHTGMVDWALHSLKWTFTLLTRMQSRHFLT